MLPDDYEPDFAATHELAAQLGNVRIPPHSVEAEQAVLGGLMLSGDSAEAFDKISDLVVEKDFY